MPQTFVKQTVIVWDRHNSILDLLDNDQIHKEYKNTVEHLQKHVKMFFGSGKQQISKDTLTEIRLFSDTESAQAWLAFNQNLADQYGRTIISSTIQDL